MSQAQLQNITSAPVEPPTSLMPLVHASHGSFREQRPITTIQTNLDMMTSFSLPDQVIPQPLQSSPSTMSTGSSGPDNSVSQNYRQEYASPTTYQSTPSYDDTQARMDFSHIQHMQPMAAQQTYSMPTCSLPGQQHLLPQHYTFEAPQQVQGLQYQDIQHQQQQEHPQQLQRIKIPLQFEQVQRDQQQQVLQHQYQHQQTWPDDQYETVSYQPPVLVDVVQEPGIINVYSNWDPQQYKLDDLDLVDGQAMPDSAIPAWSG